MNIDEALKHKKDVDEFESCFRWQLKRKLLIFTQWKENHDAGESLLIEQHDRREREALERIGVTDELIEWMFNNDRYQETLELSNDDYFLMLTYKIAPADIGDFARVCYHERQQQLKNMTLSLFEEKNA